MIYEQTNVRVYPRAEVLRGLLRLFDEIGMPQQLVGSEFIKCAVIMMLEDQTLTAAFTKRLYPAVGKKYDMNSVNVERSIRNAIQCAWLRGNREMIEKRFGNITRESGKYPVNTAFLVRLKDLLSLELIERSETTADANLISTKCNQI